MKVTIFGTGYVGLVTGTCLADMGHHVMCVDINEQKVQALKQGIIPIFEPGLDALVKANVTSGNLNFTTSAEEGVNYADVQFIAVGTPPDEDGSADLQYVLAVANSIASYMSGYKVIVNKSTVPVGTADKVQAVVEKVLQARGATLEFDVVSNPEFLKEGAAVNDCMKPDRIVIGAKSDKAVAMMKELYAPFNRNHDRMIVMDVRSSELTKYAANCMLATKISFMNEMANLAERLGADIEQVRLGIGSDPRIGYHFIYPGCGYGGSCFPKDVQALIRTADQIDFDSHILKAVEQVNERQKSVLVDRVKEHFGRNNIAGKTFALWGLAFKPNTDDMREAPARVVMEALWQLGAKVQAFDPEAMEETQRIYGQRDDLSLCGTKEAALQNADALIICTEWKNFRAPDFKALRGALKHPVVFDGRNLYDPEVVKRHDMVYYAIGRGDSIKRH